MKPKTLVLASIALFAVGMNSAMSGPCTVEIEDLTKTLAAKDAGSGPTSGASAATGGTPSAASPAQQHPPTAIMGQEAQAKATSPEDVRRQTAGQPTTTQEATTGAGAAPGNMLEASNALSRARAFDQQGKEAECMEAAREAKSHVGPR